MIADAEKEHARLSPSSAFRWTKCPASIYYTEAYPEDTTNEASAKGTIFHWIMEQCLKNEWDPSEYVGESFKEGDFTVTIDENIADVLRRGVEMVDDIAGELFVEKRINLDRWLKGQFGTMDVGVIGKRRITVLDHKFGVVPVSAERNPQIMTYALGFWDNFAKKRTNVTDFRLIIWQPFARDGGGIWDTTLDELLEFGQELRFAAKRIFDGDRTEVAGFPQCKYCIGAKTEKCPSYQRFMLKHLFGSDDMSAEAGFDMEPPFPTNLTPSERGWLIKHTRDINEWLSNMSRKALDDIMKGEKIPYVKAVEGRSSARKWADEEDAYEFMSNAIDADLVFKKTLISPTEFENYLKKANKRGFIDDIPKHILRTRKSIVLVDESSKLPAVKTVMEMFNEGDSDE